MKQAVAKIEQESSVDSFLMKAIEKGDIDTLERIVALRDAALKEIARKEYFAALSAFQKECPTIKKTKPVRSRGGDIRYSYAPLDSIVEQIKPLLDKHGFSYTIKNDFPEGAVGASCEVHHIGGHSESSSFFVPIDPDAYMNNQQKAASANSFASRYAFRNAFGILTGDEDDDAKVLGEGTNQQDLFRRFRACMDATLDHYESVMTIKHAIADGNLDTAVEAMLELNNETRQALSLAPTKGGPFTTEEVKVIKSNEWSAIRRKYVPDMDKDDLTLRVKSASTPDAVTDLLDLARELPKDDYEAVRKVVDERMKTLKGGL